MVNTRQFSGSTYMQDMTKSHTFSAKNQGLTYTPIRLICREIRYNFNRVNFESLLLRTVIWMIGQLHPGFMYSSFSQHQISVNVCTWQCIRQTEINCC